MPSKIKQYIAQNNINFYTVDSANITRNLGLGGRINTVLQAAFFKITKIIEENTSVFRLILADITGVSLIHIIGLIYMIIALIIENEPDIYTWITNQSLNTIIIDLLFGLAGIVLGNFIKETLKKIA